MEKTLVEKTFVIEGMMCERCAGRVKKALEAVPGVEEVQMSLEEKTAKAKLRDDVTGEALIAAAAGAGYEAKELN